MEAVLDDWPGFSTVDGNVGWLVNQESVVFPAKSSAEIIIALRNLAFSCPA